MYQSLLVSSVKEGGCSKLSSYKDASLLEPLSKIKNCFPQAQTSCTPHRKLRKHFKKRLKTLTSRMCRGEMVKVIKGTTSTMPLK